MTPPAMLTRWGIRSVLAALAVVALGVGVWMLSGDDKSVQYLTAKVVRGDIEEVVSATGTVHPRAQVAVGAQVSGQLIALKVKLGDRVKRGQLLALIDPVLQKNELRRAEALLRDARAQRDAKKILLRQYKLEQDRQVLMLGGRASSQAEYEVARANVDSTALAIESLRAQVAVARVGVDTATANLGYTRINAPMDGEVIAVVSRAGQTLAAAQIAPVILIIADVDTMTVRAKISEADVIRARPGLPAYFSILGAPDSRYETTLLAVEPAPESIVGEVTAQQYQQTPQQGSGAVYYNGLLEVPNPGHMLRASMTAQVSIVLGKARLALTLPVAALGRRLGDKRYEVRVLQGGLIQTRQVGIGYINDTNAQALSGVAENEEVVVGDSVSAAKAAEKAQER